MTPHNVLELFSRGAGKQSTTTVDWTGPQRGCPDVGEVGTLSEEECHDYAVAEGISNFSVITDAR